MCAAVWFVLFLVHPEEPEDDIQVRAARKGKAAEGIRDFASSGHEHLQSSSQTGVTSVECAAEDRGRMPSLGLEGKGHRRESYEGQWMVAVVLPKGH